MTETMRYLGYRLKKSLPRLAVITVIALIIALISVNDSLQHITYEDTAGGFIHTPRSGLGTMGVLMGILASIIPIVELAEFKNRRNLDTLCFFPLKRSHLAAAVFVGGFLQLIIAYTIAFFAGFIYINLSTDTLATGYMIPYFFLSLLVGLVIYAFFSFLFHEANTTVDGIIFCVMWIFVMQIVLYQLGQLFPWTPLGDMNESQKPTASALLFNNIRDTLELVGDWMNVYIPLNNLNIYFTGLVDLRMKDYLREMMDMWYMYVVWGGIGLACIAGFIARFAKKSPHRIGEISSTPFGYKVLIPLVGYSFLLSGYMADDIASVIIIFIAMTVGYIIYRRGVRFKKSDIVCLLCGLILPVLGSIF